jgi:hypothetical protein
MKTFKQLREDLGSRKTSSVLSKEQFIDFLNWVPSSHMRVVERRNDLLIQFVDVIGDGAKTPGQKSLEK